MPDDNRDYEDNDPGPCEACGGTLELEKVNLEDYQGGKLYLMESVPAYVCRDCGETWVPEPIMEEFEKMIDAAKAAKKKPLDSALRQAQGSAERGRGARGKKNRRKK
ncbi:MAG: YgiT-type zinc finger protein [bacterium]